MKALQKKVSLSYGSGGKLMHALIKGMFLKYLGNPALNALTDAAEVLFKQRRIIFTTDSFVVEPLFFPGGDIGKLSVAGTINDLVMLSGVPRYLSLSFIIQEDFPLSLLEQIVRSIASASKEAGVCVVTGDTKVVDRASCDGIFINTSGLGEKEPSGRLGYSRIREGDDIIINGCIGNHGTAIISAREDLKFKIKSDCASLHSLVIPALKEFARDIHFLRDPTRGGLATTLNEIVRSINYGVIIDEAKIPVAKDVSYACEILGFDPLYMANEGKVVMVVNSRISTKLLAFLKRHKLGIQSAKIGSISKRFPAKVLGRTSVGGLRTIDMRDGDPLPRIC
jgi:hydrogenase expression/formation protein HypE